ncbi:hypothetical protein [Tenacibaculum sp. nBUS_03]|uniref:hypothetical protein n=1 Tax=Tenacibaculum sp. nBUS_03 TaxID=3395320 RepID=UPI003EB8DEF4
MSALIQNHNELLAIVESYQAVNKNEIKQYPFLEKKLSKVIAKGQKIRKSVVAATDS